MDKFLRLQNCDDECDPGFTVSNFLTQQDCARRLQTEKNSADILTLYKQLKLQRELEKSEDLEEGIKESMIYTNYRKINEIASLIDQTNTDYPASYQQLTKSEINNTILTAIQLRQQHMLTDPLSKGGKQWATSIDQRRLENNL